MMSVNLRGSPAPLSTREVELAELAARGMPSKEIASRLFISPETVKTHLRNIFRKCGVRSRGELAAWWWHNRSAPAASQDAGQQAGKSRWPRVLVAFVALVSPGLM